MADFNPSYAIAKVEIESFNGDQLLDLSGITTQFELSQSINSDSWSGMIKCVDSTGMLENNTFKLRGEETLTLTLETYDLKLEEPIELKCHVLSVTDVVPTENLTGLAFQLNFISKLSYEAGKRRVRESFKDMKASECARTVFQKYYSKLSASGSSTIKRREELPFDSKKFEIRNSKGRHFYLQPSEGRMRAVMPSLTPSDAMNFLSQRSFSKNSPSCSYRFFETINGFFYVTDEFLVKRGMDNTRDVEVFAFNAMNSQDPNDGTEIQTNTLTSFTQGQRVDTASDLVGGAYRNKVYEVDFTRRRVNVTNYDYVKDVDYIDMSGKKATVRTSPHTEEFINETFTEENARRFLVFKDYYDEDGETLRADQHFKEILVNRTVYGAHLGRTVVQASLVGRLDITPGKLISVKVPKFTIEQSPEDPYNQQLSGNYLVLSTSHQLKNDIMNTNIVLAKYDWSGDFRELEVAP